jgi:LysM repeat protein
MPATPLTNLLNPIKSAFSGLDPNTPAVPKPAVPLAPTANRPVAPATPAITTPVKNGTSHTVAAGDTLSSIAAKNKMSLADLLNLNPQFKTNPNLIKPGQTVTLGGSAIPSATPISPAAPVTPTINPATGGMTPPPAPATPSSAGGQQATLVNSQGQKVVVTAGSPEAQNYFSQGYTLMGGTPNPVVTPTAPVVPDITTKPETPVVPTAPAENPLFTNPNYEAAVTAYEQAQNLTPEEISNQEAINNLEASIRTGITGEAERPIPLDFITGRQKAIENRGLALEQPLTAKAALLQAKRTAALEASKFRLDTEASKLSALREASKPVAVAPGTSLINPLTGKTVASGGSVNDVQARDTFYNLSQTYPDAKIVWDDSLTPQQNLTNAQKAASESPSFQAKNTVYAINPLTGEPTIISKMGGGNTPTPTTPTTVDTNTLAPELKSALTSVSGIQFFDSSKVTSAQLPYLQRAAQEMGVPLLSKEDANKIQDSFQSFSSANSLVNQIVNLTSSVLTAPDNAAAQTVQAANLKAIELAPSFSTNNAAKQFISARNSVLSLLTRAAGEKGVLTNQDIERVAQALPSYSDSATLAAQKAANFSSVLQSVLTGAISAYIGTPAAASAAGGSSVATIGGDTFKLVNGVWQVAK